MSFYVKYQHWSQPFLIRVFFSQIAVIQNYLWQHFLIPFEGKRVECERIEAEWLVKLQSANELMTASHSHVQSAFKKVKIDVDSSGTTNFLKDLLSIVPDCCRQFLVKWNTTCQ